MPQPEKSILDQLEAEIDAMPLKQKNRIASVVFFANCARMRPDPDGEIADVVIRSFQALGVTEWEAFVAINYLDALAQERERNPDATA